MHVNGFGRRALLAVFIKLLARWRLLSKAASARGPTKSIPGCRNTKFKPSLLEQILQKSVAEQEAFRPRTRCHSCDQPPDLRLGRSRFESWVGRCPCIQHR